MRFLSTLFASILGTLIAFGLLFFIGLFFLAALSSAGRTAPNVRSGSVLILPLTGQLTEIADEDPMALAMGQPRAHGVRTVTSALQKAAVDERIAAVWIRSQGLRASFASLEEIRDAVTKVSESGKPVFASSGSAGFSETEYFLASAADYIYAPPEARFEFNGFYLIVQFLKGTLEKLDIEPQVVRAGKFKSAVEPFLRTDASPENEEQLQALLTSFENVYVEAIESARELSADEIRRLWESGSVTRSDEALAAGLIDSLLFDDQAVEAVKAILEIDAEEKLRQVSLSQYARVPESVAGIKRGREGTIAVLQAVGAILPGEGGFDSDPLFGERVIGSDTFRRTMRDLREDDDIKSIVLRINSPGGSAMASDAILQEVRLTQAEKPVVVSMGGMAASGGYYIASLADTIVANKGTLTGSIGVYSLLLNMGPFWENKVGMTTDVVRTSTFSDMFTGLRSLTPPEIAVLEEDVDRIYDRFLSLVSEGREMSVDSIDQIAKGRVWSGSDAVDVGLVDVLGTLDDAIGIAARMAGLEEGSYRLDFQPRPRTLFDQISRALQTQAVSLFASRRGTNDELHQYVRSLEAIRDMHGRVEARMPTTITLR